MYINSLGMRDENNAISGISPVGSTSAVSRVNAVRKADGVQGASTAGKSSKQTSSTGTFPAQMERAIKNQSAKEDDSAASAKVVSEALERLKSDPEWADVGEALSALYKNQQQMQVNLLKLGYSNSMFGMSGVSSLTGLTSMMGLGGMNGLTGLTGVSGSSGLTDYSSYAYGNRAAAAYKNSSANLSGSSIFANQLI